MFDYSLILLVLHFICLITHNDSDKWPTVFGYKVRYIISSTHCSYNNTFKLLYKQHFTIIPSEFEKSCCNQDRL